MCPVTTGGQKAMKKAAPVGERFFEHGLGLFHVLKL
jgi:hypothetical protein